MESTGDQHYKAISLTKQVHISSLNEDIEVRLHISSNVVQVCVNKPDRWKKILIAKMTITVTPKLEKALFEEAQKLGTTPEQLALDHLSASFVLTKDEAVVQPEVGPDASEDQRETNKAALEVLRAWRAQNATTDPAVLEQRREEWEEFKAALNESHTSSDRVLFP